MEYTKSLLVTGGCGFIGSNFINYISNKYPDYFICCLDALYYCANINNINVSVRQSSRFVFINASINDFELVKNILIKHKITDIIHFAAQSHVDNSFDDSLQYTLDNVLGTHTLLEAVRIVSKNSHDIRFYHFSTDEVYGDSEHTDTEPKTEMSLLCPTNPYAATKASAEMLVSAYKYSYKIKSIITRCNNVYGPNQYPEKLIPKFIRLLKNNEKMTVHGDGSSLRSFVHVDDVCNAVDYIMQKGDLGEIYNIGSEKEYSVLEVAKLLISLLKPGEECCKWIDFVQDRPFNDKRYFISNNKIKQLGWNQEKDFHQEIKKLI